MLIYQPGLFVEEPGYDPELRGLERTDLGAGAWIDAVPKVAHADLGVSVQFRSAPVEPTRY